MNANRPRASAIVFAKGAEPLERLTESSAPASGFPCLRSTAVPSMVAAVCRRKTTPCKEAPAPTQGATIVAPKVPSVATNRVRPGETASANAPWAELTAASPSPSARTSAPAAGVPSGPTTWPSMKLEGLSSKITSPGAGTSTFLVAGAYPSAVAKAE